MYWGACCDCPKFPEACADDACCLDFIGPEENMDGDDE